LRIVGVVGVEDVLGALRERMPLAKGKSVKVVRGSERSRRKHVELVEFSFGLNVAAPVSFLEIKYNFSNPNDDL
jgi:hypothetical protein